MKIELHYIYTHKKNSQNWQLWWNIYHESENTRQKLSELKLANIEIINEARKKTGSGCWLNTCNVNQVIFMWKCVMQNCHKNHQMYRILYKRSPHFWGFKSVKFMNPTKFEKWRPHTVTYWSLDSFNNYENRFLAFFDLPNMSCLLSFWTTPCPTYWL